MLADPVHHVAADASKFMLLPTASDREAALALPSSSASSPPPPPHHLPSHRHHHVVIFPADSTPRGAWSLINPPPRSHIPPPPEFFFGRQLEMFRLVNKLMARRLVVLHGGVGVGKSALAVSSAHYLHQRHEFATALIDVAQHAQLLAVASARQRPIGSASAFSAHAASSGSMPNAAFAPTLVRTASEAPYVLSHASAASSSSDRSDALRPLQSVHRSSRDLMLAVLIDLANAALGTNSLLILLSLVHMSSLVCTDS